MTLNVMITSGGPAIEDFQTRATEVVAQRESAFRQCYSQVLNARPEVGGRVSLDYSIDARGEVLDVRVARAADDELGECSAKVVRRLRFPVPNDVDIPIRGALFMFFKPGS